MDPGTIFLSACKTLATPVVAGWELVANRTRLKLLLPRGEAVKESDAHVLDQNNGMGLFYFGVTSSSEQDIEVSEINVTFDSPLSMRDPASPGLQPFFVQGQSTDAILPFALTWSGKFLVKHRLIVPFGIEAHFMDGLQASEIQVSLKAKRLAKRFGYIFAGKETVKIQKIVLRRSYSPPHGLLIPEMHRSAPVQPFMRVTASAVSGGAVRVSTVDAVGRSDSRLV